MRAAILLSFLLLAGCEERTGFEIRNLNGNRISVLGHRGMGRDSKYPGNSFESIAAVLEIGADGSELDIRMTKDSVLVIFHDDELSPKTNCQGMLRELTWEEIKDCAYNNSPSPSYVISVDDLFSRIPDIRKYVFSFDCKLSTSDDVRPVYFRQFVQALKRVIEKHGMHDRVLIEAGNAQFHQMLQNNDVPVLRFITGKEFEDALRIAGDLDLYGIGIGSRITRKQIEEAHAKGFRVMTWTPRTPRANVKAIQKNPDFIQTDAPTHMLKVFGRYQVRSSEQ
ncbi:MAG: hypothetical protein JSU61_12540 [Fidelibacterota bacterium]|nr:MAG: hypothetical protein JSU61_12540 [Candidatus Neomarinimicrobiota bacterium]